MFIPHALAHDLKSDDLSDYIRPYDTNVILLAETIGLKPFLSYPLENIQRAYYWVSQNIKYMYDSERWGDEYWQLPSTTIRLGTGDCEDQAILLASLLRALRIPRDNVRIAVSYTHKHAWVEVKLPLPVYGLEKIATRSLDLLRNKKVSFIIGDVTLEREITDSMINEIKAIGLGHNNGWIPLDPTAKIIGIIGAYPVPFSWWLMYGYNVYRLFGLDSMTPERYFQDRARILEFNREIRADETISLEIPCISGDRILGAIKAKSVQKEQILNIRPEIGWYNIRFGPCPLGAGETLRFEWSADRAVDVYILNEADLRNLGIIMGQPAPSSRASNRAQIGFVQYTTPYQDNFYIYIRSGQTFVIYTWTIKRIWQETTCNVQVLISDPQGTHIESFSVFQRDVERLFDFTAERSGVYRVTLRNVGESAPVYLRLEEYSAPLSSEVAGISDSLVHAEQEYLSEVAKDIGKVLTSISISVEPREATVGEEVTIKGFISPSMSTTITLLITRPDGSEETLTTTSEDSGSFTFRVKLDKEGIWTFTASYSGDFIHEASQSIQMQIEARTLLSKLLPYLMAIIIAIVTIIVTLTILKAKTENKKVSSIK